MSPNENKIYNKTPQRVGYGAGGVLTEDDRCDRCGARGYVLAMFVLLSGADLVFCAHHGRRYREALSRVADVVHDESARVLAP